MPDIAFAPGRVGTVSRSGSITYYIADTLTRSGYGESTCVGLGGDPVLGSTFDEILMLFEDYKGALEKFEKALELEPHGLFAYQTNIKMGVCHGNLGNYEEASEYYKKGKLLTERMLPYMREMYGDKAERYLEEIQRLKK